MRALEEASRDLLALLESLTTRRFRRYPARLPVVAVSERAPESEVTRLIGRGGFSLITRREPQLGETTRYQIRLPRPLPTIEVDGITVIRRAELGQASLQVGVQFSEFHEDGERQWVRLIEALTARAAA